MTHLRDSPADGPDGAVRMLPDEDSSQNPMRPTPIYVPRILHRDAGGSAVLAAPPWRKEIRRLDPRVLVVLAAILVLLTAVNLARAMRHPVVATPAEEVVTARFMLYLVAQELDSHLEEHGMLPATLAVINADDARVAYERRGTDYTLTAEAGGQTLTYRSGTDPRPFWSAAAELPEGWGQ